MTQDVEGKRESYVIYPSRFRWLKRGARGCVLLLLIAGILRFWWGYEADERFAALGPAARARGEPFYPEDFRQLPIPDEENAAVPIQEAVEQLAGLNLYEFPFVSNELTPPEAKDLPEIQGVLSHCQPALQLVRSARSRPKAVYAGVPSYPYFLNTLPNSSSYAMLRRIVGLAGSTALAKNRDDDAVEYIHDLLIIENTFGHARAAATNGLRMRSIDRLADELVFRSAMDLKINPQTASDASRDHVSQLIAALLDEEIFRACSINSYFGERTQIINVVAHNPPISINWFNEPLYKFDCCLLDQHYQMQVDACRQSNWQSARQKESRVLVSAWGASPIQSMMHPLTVVPELSHDPIFDFFHTLADRRMAATMLAIRLYAVDHQGALPESLSALVPQYLPAVPSDPFDANDNPIRYLPKYNPPVLYSVGYDGKDDGGAGMPMSRWRDKDYVYPLVAEPRISPPRKVTARRSTIPQK